VVGPSSIPSERDGRHANDGDQSRLNGNLLQQDVDTNGDDCRCSGV
jgi:hypothetical protein